MTSSRAGGAAYFRRRLVNAVMLAGGGLAALLAIAALFAVLGYVLVNGFGAINLDLFTKLPAPAGESGGGMANAIVGSLIVLALASAFALPISLLAGVFLSEFGAGKFPLVVRFVIETMAGIPSIVVGIFAFIVLVRPMGGFSALAGGFALGFIMIPIFSRASEEALRTVSPSLREASLALGVPAWKTVLRVVLPAASPGLVTAFMLAVARAGGETAPLLFTALGNQFWQRGLTGPIATLPVQVFNYSIGPYDDWHRQAWAGSLVLLALILVIVGAVRFAYKGARVKA